MDERVRGTKPQEEQEREKDVESGEGKREKDVERGEGKREKKRRRGKRRLTGSLAAKIVAFFLLAIFCLAGLVSLFGSMYMGVYGFYTESWNDVLLDALSGMSVTAMNEVSHRVERGDVKLAEAYCEDRNIDFKLIWTEDGYGEYDEYEEYGGSVLWSTWDGDDTRLSRDWHVTFNNIDQESKPVVLNHHTLDKDEIYLFRIYIDPEFPKEDEFQRVAMLVSWLYDARYGFIIGTAVSVFLCMVCFIFLLCSAGHHNDREGIVSGVLTGIPVDVLTVLFGAVIVMLLFVPFGGGWNMSDEVLVALMLIYGVALVVLLTFYFMDIALRVKLGIGLRHSLTYRVMSWVGRVFCFLGRGFLAMVRGFPLVLTVVTAYLGLCILEFFGILMVLDSRGELAGVLWIMEKAALFVVVVYVALACRKLLEAGRALAEGEGDYKVDTSRLLWDFKEHGENLNSLGRGISKAVAERLKSERMKTELITNVSHDIKTPLTSIINYADLICEELGMNGEKAVCQRGRGVEVNGEDGEAGSSASAGDGEGFLVKAGTAFRVEYARIAEYAEVLLRQSRRLKKLLEDLVEASKATTGNLEVNLEPCEIGVLLSQAVGEYQQRMAEKELELIARQPERPVEIMADGRRLWRVFENLLNNICKYAQENSRVYLSVEVREENALVIFRNMSKYPLDLSVEELEERFVRGDKSRHMEGNGLGLSIAKSLVELQNGKMEIVIDGDLFKVTLSFRVLPGGKYPEYPVREI